MAAEQSYVRTDNHGVIRVGTTQISLDSVVAAWDQGHSTESIRSQYPALSLLQVYGALTWCLEHPDEVEAYLKRQGEVWSQSRAKVEGDPPPVLKRLQEMRAVNTKGE
jgi:uncharacterized protein (DUF433 family)